nr:MAG TPA: hypothetical protein [Caudoviricetes sp.]
MKWVRRYTVRSCCWIIEKSTITDVSNANEAILTSETKRKEKNISNTTAARLPIGSNAA